MTIRNKPRDAAVFGVDLGKNLFHVCGLSGRRADPAGDVPRDTLLQFLRAGYADGRRHGGVPGLAVAGAQTPGNGPHGSDRSGEVREALW